MIDLARELDERFFGASYRWDATGELPDEPLELCARHGAFGAFMPEAQGGAQWDLEALRRVFESLGAVSGSLGSVVNVQHMVLDALRRGASDAQLSRWTPSLVSGAQLASFCLTEAQAGTDISKIQTTYEPKGDQVRLRGSKRWITTASRASVFLVFGQQGGQPTAGLVPRDTPGLTVTPVRDLLGLRSAHLADLEFDCVLPAEAMVGIPGFGLNLVAAQGLLRGRMNVAWMACGMIRAALERVARWALERESFGAKLIDQGQVRGALARMGVDLQAARALAQEAARRLEARDPEATDAVMGAKYFACRAASEHCGVAVRLHGARGCHEPNGLSRLYRDAKIFEVIEGATEALESILGPAFAREYARGR